MNNSSSKGISPLIASVLLIAFTMAVAGMAGPWFADLIQSTGSEVTDDTQDVKDSSLARIDITQANYNPETGNITATIQNKGEIEMENFTVTVLGNETIQKQLDVKLGKGDIHSLEIEAEEPDILRVNSRTMSIQSEEELSEEDSDTDNSPDPVSAALPGENWLDRDDSSYTMVADLDPDGENKEWHTLATNIGWDDEQEISEVSARIAESNDRDLAWYSIRITDMEGNTVEPTSETRERIGADNGNTEVMTKTFDNPGAITTTIDEIELLIANPSTQSYSEFRVHELEFDMKYGDDISYCNTC